MNVKTANRFVMRPTKIALAYISALLFVTVCTAADPVENKNAKAESLLGKLQLVGGDIYRGEFGKASDANGNLVWKCPAFLSDIVVPWNSVESLVQPFQTPKPIEDGRPIQFIVEFQNGEALTGNVTSISEEFVDVENELIGAQHIPASTVRSILRTPMMSASESGELKFTDWKQITPDIKKGKRWFDGLGSYDTETAGTVISQSVTMPDLAAIDLSVSWQTSSPNFVLQIGDTEQRKLELHVRKPENKNTLSVSMLVEDDVTADIATITQPLDGSNGISLRLLCDSVRGRLVVTQNGVALAQLPLSKNMRLTGKQTVLFSNNVAGRLSLRSLKIYRSIFSTPVLLSKGKETENGQIKSPETLLQNGQTFIGQPVGFEPKDHSFGFANSETIGRVSLDQVDRIEYPYAPIAVNKMAEHKLFSVQLWSGARFVGQAVSIQSEQLVVSLLQSKTEVRILLSDIMSIGQSGKLKSDMANDDSKNAEEAPMRLNSPWAISSGRIVPMDLTNSSNAAPKTDFQTLNWRPSNALFPVAIASGVTGTIEPIANMPKVDKPAKPKVTADFGRSLDKDEPSLFLKSGDCFAADIQSVSDGEMFFKSSLFSANKIDIDMVRGVRKLIYTGTDTMEKAGRKRLLTLPRSQRNNPPTHLVVSREGDAIRGQLLSMDVDNITLQVRGEERKIQMKSVAEIIWLQDAPEIVPPGKKPEAMSPAEVEVKVDAEKKNKGDLVCQALDSSGTRVSIAPERVDGDILYGQHPQLGDCHIDLSKISKLVLGDAIADEARKNRFGKWTLENAPDPKFVNDLDSPEAEDGNVPDSAHAKMIGNVAPDFELKKLDGTLLKLSDLRGRVIVLDFWATWCGPCVASLPKITDLGQEFKGAEVDVIAVNIEQTSAEVRALLDRLKISPVVVLDSDGAVARAYHAQAIPQTVIIDRDGKVKQVIVGGGGTSESKIRESLDGMLNLKL
jgi:thiol-disulfide isomerase/thioredoxin